MTSRFRMKRALRTFPLVAAALCVAGLSGCASIAGGSQSIGNAVGVKDRTTASTVGGCIVGGLTGALAGGLAKGWVGAGIGLAGGCAAGGFISREASLQQQLKEAQEQQKQINATLAQYHSQLAAVVYTKQVADQEKGKENHKIEAWDKTTVPMPAGHGEDVQAVLKKVASLTASSKKVPRIDVYVKRADEPVYSQVLNDGLQGSKVSFSVHYVTKNPHLDVTPIPDPVSAPAASSGASAPASGAIYHPAQ
ncbi:hypothetical protein [Burkholderia vietnamiensis]|uniref:hypothetical protein n=1 Tax=Burkholderia vietnamiensis TaxID=60552 RepID=UPI001CF2F2D1|nr:hypothetical protein [Burkholderia vietnamiensis]MCA8448857.1 hypothetical protein [Burkholderia vietnamiensis]